MRSLVMNPTITTDEFILPASEPGLGNDDTGLSPARVPALSEDT